MTPSDKAFIAFSHRFRRFNAPISEPHLNELARVLSLGKEDRILDLGCGTGAWLLALVARSGAAGTGVDLDAAAIEEAKRRASREQPDARFDWHASAAEDFLATVDAAFDCALCVGASHAFGGMAATLRAVWPALRPGGRLLLGEGYWQRPPDPEYIEFLGGTENESHQANVDDAEREGYTCVWASTASVAEWDAFEWDFFRVAHDFAAQFPSEDPAKRLEQRTRWRNGYLRWGRSTMGFGYYILERLAARS